VIWITQWLCPSRHCTIAVFWDTRLDDIKSIEAKGEEVFKTGINRWCGICGSKELAVEHTKTQFENLAAAEAAGREEEAKQLLTRALIGGKY
jgi:hypothetical protein